MPARRGNQNSLSRSAEMTADLTRATAALYAANIPFAPAQAAPPPAAFFARMASKLAPAAVKVEMSAQDKADFEANLPTLRVRRTLFQMDQTHCCGFKYIHGIQGSRMRPSYDTFEKTPAGALLRQHAVQLDFNAHFWTPGPDDFVDYVFNRMPDVQCGQVAFVEALSEEDKPPKKALSIAAYIREKELGEVVAIPVQLNPNSFNYLHTFVWNVHLANLKEWRR